MYHRPASYFFALRIVMQIYTLYRLVVGEIEIDSHTATDYKE